MREMPDIAMEHIINQIIHHRIMPGTILYETTISEELSMSRTPVRQALNTAVSMGILEHAKGKRGYLLPPLTSQDMEQVFYTRKAIESQAVVEAAQNIPPEATSMLMELIEKESQYIKDKDRFKYAISNQKIHKLFVELSNNIYLKRIFEPIFWRASLYDFYFSDFYNDSIIQSDEQYFKSHEEHNKIAHAICEKDKEIAKLFIEIHFINTINIHKKRYQKITNKEVVK